MAHTGRITKELRKKLYKEIQDSIFKKLMEAVKLAGDGGRKSEIALKAITKCVVELAIEEAESKHKISLVPEQELNIEGIEWQVCENLFSGESK